jgi:hypothetical protein
MTTWVDEEILEDPEDMKRIYEAEDYTPWIVSLPMPFTKEIEQNLRVSGFKLRKQIQADLKKNPLLWDALRRPARKHPTT